jgi:protein-S-isoprenylcysteine O-methyltransferase Ste14
MHALQTAIGIAWIIFWLYWLVAAAGAKQSARRRGWLPRTGGLSAVAVVVLVRVLARGSAAVHSPGLAAVGAVIFACGIGLAVWARIYLGRNWGMPMTQRAEPELVTSGPYRFVRHPIYSGLLLALLGTSLATSLWGLIIVVVLTAYFSVSATVEERNLTAIFPAEYPAYRTHTKMLIPFVL